MDPEAALKEIRDLVEAIRERIDEHDGDDVDTMDPDDLVTIAEDANALVDRFEGLDAWMSRGGFLPASWSEGRGGKAR